ncbi:hypothetical protein XELAEV_18003625mg [Xenopus laevis]|nr:hypothetical protein XELAEV_18003625mg [Xenopus laevis]
MFWITDPRPEPFISHGSLSGNIFFYHLQFFHIGLQNNSTKDSLVLWTGCENWRTFEASYTLHILYLRKMKEDGADSLFESPLSNQMIFGGHSYFIRSPVEP